MTLLAQREGCDVCGEPQGDEFGLFVVCQACIHKIQRSRSPRVTVNVRCDRCAGSGTMQGREDAIDVRRRTEHICESCHGVGRRNVVFVDPDVDFEDDRQWLRTSLEREEGYEPYPSCLTRSA